jgi:response regulator RpfG family c-di-GMP phosphodiesterase
MEFTEKILFVDDEPNLLAGIKRQLYTLFNIDTADSGESALKKIIEDGPFAVIVVDMRMPVMDGLTLLKKVQELAPDTVRMMLTGNVDVQTAQNAINEGNIFRYMIKPFPSVSMVQNLKAAIKQYQLITAEKQLLEQTLNSTIKLLVDILSLLNPMAFSKTQRQLVIVKHIMQELNMENSWQYEIAVMLSQIGSIILPQHIINLQYSSDKLIPEDIELLDGHPAIAKKLIENIPRLQDVAIMISLQNTDLKSLIATENNYRQNIILGAQLIRISNEIEKMLSNLMPSDQIINTLLSNPDKFNKKFVQALNNFKFQRDESLTISTTVDRLDISMITAENIVDKTGRILLARNHEINAATIEYLKSFAKRVGIIEPFNVIKKKTEF